MKLLVVELDVREGGDYVIHMGPHTVRGTYEEIVLDEKLPTEESREQHDQGWTGSFVRLEQHLADAR